MRENPKKWRILAFLKLYVVKFNVFFKKQKGEIFNKVNPPWNVQKCNKKVDILGWRIFSRILSNILRILTKKSGHTEHIGNCDIIKKVNVNILKVW